MRLLLYARLQQLDTAGSRGGGVVFRGDEQVEALGRRDSLELAFELVSELQFAEVLRWLSIGLHPYDVGILRGSQIGSFGKVVDLQRDFGIPIMVMIRFQLATGCWNRWIIREVVRLRRADQGKQKHGKQGKQDAALHSP